MFLRFGKWRRLLSAEARLFAQPKGLLDIPVGLSIAIEGLLKKVPKPMLKEFVEKLLSFYQESCQIRAEDILHPKPDQDISAMSTNMQYEYGEGEAMAYVASQMPYSVSIAERVLCELRDFRPQTVLDFGAGPGSALWAMDKLWPHQKDQITAIDLSTAMLGVLKVLAQSNPRLSSLQVARVLESETTYDLVMASHVLTELPDDAARQQVISMLWNCTKDALVLIDRGHPFGYRSILKAREMLLEAGAFIQAPCPHQLKCPMQGGWCHFTQRLQPLAFQPKIPGGFLDVKFSYLIARRHSQDSSSQLPRLIRPPLKRSGHVIIDVCAKEGQMQRFTAARSHGKEIYKDAR